MHKLPYLYNFYFNLEYSISNMRMRSITLAQGSERVWRCTNQDGTFPRAVHNFSNIPCFGSSFRQLFLQSGGTRTLAPFCLLYKI